MLDSNFLVICAGKIRGQHSRRERCTGGLVPAKVAPDEVPVVAVAAEGFAAASRAMGG